MGTGLPVPAPPQRPPCKGALVEAWWVLSAVGAPGSRPSEAQGSEWQRRWVQVAPSEPRSLKVFTLSWFPAATS